MSRRLQLRGRGIRLRFTAMYMALFLLSGAGLLAITNLVAGGEIRQSVPADPRPRNEVAAPQQQIIRLQAELDRIHTDQSRQLLTGSAVALLVMVAVSAVLGRVVAGRVLRPLRTVTAATRRITADNLHERLAVTAPHDEVKDLSDTIDGLLERLEGAFDAQRRFVANASHELRTPLTTMRAALDVAMAKPAPIPAQTTMLADRFRVELDQIDRLLDGLLLLARVQHGALPDQVTVPLGRLVSEALELRAAAIAEKELTVHRDLDESAWISGSRTLLSRMVDNVIDNAVIHNHRGGWIRVAVTGDGLVVESGGRVLDQEQVSRLGQPFQRLGAERTGNAHGSGLGLSIVSDIATASGGGLDLRARPEGGLRVAIALPLGGVPG
ncbi:two-component sensor histidine kinase [Acrocarpospora phusangensis]|uniref:histidine kinase n=1 Tax=Acrocarpospora phusangensis TaxID=1070424 RepID=A0A919QA93_9ACTN|nr:HAMP domain-containing sensor histidine kinase [Acrocarpospora phusangensis]GIH25222.1 two-component sensor histidine kinase [Acrocarpospora phusangensis]